MLSTFFFLYSLGSSTIDRTRGVRPSFQIKASYSTFSHAQRIAKGAMAQARRGEYYQALLDKGGGGCNFHRAHQFKFSPSNRTRDI